MAISGSPTLLEPQLVERPDGVERVALEVGVDAAGVREVEHGIAAGAELDALVDRRQEAAAPVRVAAAGPLVARAEDDEAGQVLRLAAQAVGDPGAHARPAEDLRAGAHHDLPGRVVERVGDHPLDDGDVVDDRREVRQQLGELGAALAVPGELELGAEQLRVGLDERGAIALDQLRRRQRAVELGELRLVVEQLQVAGRAGHEEEQDPLGLRCIMRRLRRQRIEAAAALPASAAA